MAKYHNDCHTVLKEAEVFPIEVDLSRSTFTYDDSNQFNDEEDEEDEDGEVDGEEQGIEVHEDGRGADGGIPTSGDLISTD